MVREAAGAHFPSIAVELGDVEGPSGEVLHYGVELMGRSAAWWSALEERVGAGRVS